MSNVLLRLEFFLALDGDTPNSLSIASLTFRRGWSVLVRPLYECKYVEITSSLSVPS